jgi:hypothetical protein
LGALLVSVLAPGSIEIVGDSAYVIGLLNKHYVPKDVFMVSCVDLIMDMLAGWGMTCTWTSRDNN